MRLEIGENLGWTTFGICLLVFLTLTLTKGCHLENEFRKEAVKAGLVQQQQLGTSGSIWVKPETK